MGIIPYVRISADRLRFGVGGPPAVFAAGAVAALGAVASYAVRTRKISPFSGLARFVRERVDPWLIAPDGEAFLRAGGTPYSAPAGAGHGRRGRAADHLGARFCARSGVAPWRGNTAGRTALRARALDLGVLQIALFARVISSWVGGTPYSKWWRWSYVLTEPILAPLRRVVPTIGMIDITVLIAYFGLQLLEGVILRAL